MSKGIKVCAGDFAVGSVGKISYSSGKPCAISFEDRSIRERFLRDLSESIESIPLHNLVRVEIVAQDNVGKSGNMILRGVVGGALLGPVGAIAGAATTARRQTEIMFRADFNDGRTLVATADFESFTCLKSAEFATEKSGGGKPQDPGDHPAHNVPQATQHYAGDVLPIKGELSMGPGQDSRAAEYAVGKKSDPKVIPMPRGTTIDWARRQSK
jgi:hypothetical protein